MPQWARLPVRVKGIHIIVDGQQFRIDKEYAELGMKKGWLVNHRIVETKDHITYYYQYVE